jgi:hypothetical protein
MAVSHRLTLSNLHAAFALLATLKDSPVLAQDEREVVIRARPEYLEPPPLVYSPRDYHNDTWRRDYKRHNKPRRK